MKLAKLTNAVSDERDLRIEQLERRLEQLHPSPRPETIRPYSIGDEVFGVRDEEGNVPMTVVSYPLQEGFANVMLEGDIEPRRFPLESLRTLERCPERSPYAFMTEGADGGLKRAEIASPEPGRPA